MYGWEEGGRCGCADGWGEGWRENLREESLSVVRRASSTTELMRGSACRCARASINKAKPCASYTDALLNPPKGRQLITQSRRIDSPKLDPHQPHDINRACDEEDLHERIVEAVPLSGKEVKVPRQEDDDIDDLRF
jgi:hypothetical protein